MIRLATCFSGIGAIEHALNRMGIDNKIIFACDNGDVDIFSKKIPLDILEIRKEFKVLQDTITESSTEEYKLELEHDKDLFDSYTASLENINGKYTDIVCQILIAVGEMEKVKKHRYQEYEGFLQKLKNSAIDTLNRRLHTLYISIEIVNDFSKDNNWQDDNKQTEFKSSDDINWKILYNDVISLKNFIDEVNGRRIIKNIRDVCERLSMLHEKILTENIIKKMKELATFDEKKKYIDNLYSGYEKRNQVKKTYMANYDIDERNFHWNASFLDGTEYTGVVDLFVGGSPCQSFSLVGKQRGLEDTRGTLFYEYARLVKEIQPKVFIYENVKAILSNDKGKTWDTITRTFTDLNYKWYYKILNAKDYGIPQNRERVFVVGFRNDLVLKKDFNFPVPQKLKSTMKDFLIDNVSGKYYLPNKGVKFVTSDKNLVKRYTQIDGDIALCQKKNQQFNWHGDFVFVEENSAKESINKDLEKYFLSEKVKKYVLSTGTKGFYSKPEIDLDIARPLLTTMHKMHRAGVDNYVTTEGRIRKLTPRECLRLMGFSDSFKIVVSDTAMYQQSGNSIVVDVLMHIMDKILESIPELDG